MGVLGMLKDKPKRLAIITTIISGGLIAYYFVMMARIC